MSKTVLIKDIIVLIKDIIETNMEDGSYWINYNIKKEGVGETKQWMGIEYSTAVNEDTDTIDFSNMVNDNQELFERFTNKPLESICGPLLTYLLTRCLELGNNIVYVNYEDMEELNITKDDLNSLKDEVEVLGLDGYVAVDEGDYAICVYSGIVTRFLY